MRLNNKIVIYYSIEGGRNAMSDGIVVKKLTNSEEDLWETVDSIKTLVKGDRIRMYLCKKDAANNKVFSDSVVMGTPFVDEDSSISSLDIIPYKEYLKEQELKQREEN